MSSVLACAAAIAAAAVCAMPPAQASPPAPRQPGPAPVGQAIVQFVPLWRVYELCGDAAWWCHSWSVAVDAPADRRCQIYIAAFLPEAVRIAAELEEREECAAEAD